MKSIIALAFFCGLFTSCSDQKTAEQNTETTSAETTASGSKSTAVEFTDSKYAAIGEQGLSALTSGDIDGWMNTFADNAVYVWNAGDSLAGKTAIANYWKKRRTEVIDSITFSNAIWLPIKVNQPQSVEQAGVWLLAWYQVDAKYKSGKKMTQWLHVDSHFNSDDKIDRQIMYIDRVPVNAAVSK